jgi:hypothetical protein
MTQDYVFEYFPDYRQWAKFTDEPCNGCGQADCLEGIYFGGPSSLTSVCLECLVAGRISVQIPSHVKATLEKSIQETFPDQSLDQLQQLISERLDKLSMTPPVPWIQYNEWPVCEGNFCRYIGEWDQLHLTKDAPQNNGLQYLMSLLTDPETIGHPDDLWASIESEISVVFMFECLESSRRIAVIQSF